MAFEDMLPIGASIASMGVAAGVAAWVGRQQSGTEGMMKISSAVRTGAMAFLRREFKIVIPVAIILAIIIGFASSFSNGVAFAVGAALSGIAGLISLRITVKAAPRAAHATSKGLGPAFATAFRGGATVGLSVPAMALIAITSLYFVYPDPLMIAGVGIGASLIALFIRACGGIFTKAADLGADLVGKVEAGIPEDDPRNPATIAGNVGDNVGDCAGMAADLFESYEVTLVASIILGVAAFNSIDANPALGLIFPVIARAIGVLASIVGVYMVRATDRDKSAMAPINRGFLTAGILTVIGTAIVAFTYVGNETEFNEGTMMFLAVVAGLVLAQIASRLTEYFTSTETTPVREIAEATRTGPATTVLSGISSGLESSVWAIVAIAGAIGVAIGLGGGNLQFSLYLVALAGMGMLATTGVVVSEDTFGPVADNAAGIAEMSGEFEGEAQKVMVSLDAVGNTTKAVTKGFAIGSAVIAAVALFSSFIETIAGELNLEAVGSALFLLPETQINVADPKTFIGLLIGGSIAFLFSALAIRAVGRSAGTVVHEVRRQFRERKIMEGIDK